MVKIFHACTANQSSRPNVVTLKRNKYQTTSPFKTLYILFTFQKKTKRVEDAFHLHFKCFRGAAKAESKNVTSLESRHSSCSYRQLTALCQDLLLFSVDS